MALRNWVECPVCGRKDGVVDDYSKPAGCVRQALCLPCNILDRQERKPLGMARAVAWAAEQVANGYSVAMRDVETSKTVTFSKYNLPSRYSVAQPDRRVIVAVWK